MSEEFISSYDWVRAHKKEGQSDSKGIVQTVVYTWEDRSVTVDVEAGCGCEYSKRILGCDVLRSCELQPFRVFDPNRGSRMKYGQCMAIAYALNFERCPIRKKALEGGV